MREIRLTDSDFSECLDKIPSTGDVVVVVAYLRVSSRHQAEDGNSLEAQEYHIRNACLLRLGEDCAIIWVADEGMPGWIPYAKPGQTEGRFRKGLTTVCELVERGIGHYVMVNRCSRLCRDTGIWYRFYQDYLHPHAVHFIAAAEGCDTLTESGRKFIDLLMALAQLEAGNIRGHLKDAWAERKKLLLAGTPAFGWRREDRRRIEKGSRVNIEPHPEQAPVVRRIFDLALPGRSNTEIASELNSLGLANPSGRPGWTKDQVHSVLRNAMHCGRVKDAQGDWQRGRHYDKRIVEESEFDEVQRMLNARSARLRYARPPEDMLLNGLIRCGLCGRMVSISRKQLKGEITFRYWCYGAGHLKHRGYSVSVESVAERVTRAIKELSGSTRLADVAATRAREDIEDQRHRLSKHESRLMAVLARRKRQFAVQLRRALSAGMGDEQVVSVRDAFRRDKADIQAQLQQTRDDLARLEALADQGSPAIQSLSRVGELWDEMSWEERRELASHLIEELTLQPDRTHVILHLKLIFSERLILRIHTHPRSGKSPGLDGATPSELTTAFYMMDGNRASQIAKIRRVTRGQVDWEKRELMKRVGTEDVNTMLATVAPIIEERRAELLIGKKQTSVQPRPMSEVEKEFIRLVCRGLTGKQACESLGLSPSKATGIRSRIYYLWNVMSQEQMVEEAIRRGMVPEDSRLLARHGSRPVKAPTGAYASTNTTKQEETKQ